MKKVLLFAGATAMCLVAFSFKPLETQKSNYESVSHAALLKAALATSFQSSYDNHSDKNVVYSKYHKVWTSLEPSDGQTAQQMNSVVDNN